MIGLMILGAVAGVVVVAMAYIWFSPNIPDGYSNPKSLRKLQVMINIFGLWCKFRSFFGGSVLSHFTTLNRKMLDTLHRPLPQELSAKYKIEMKTVAGVDVRIYSPKEDPGTPSPCIIYIHGGGWVTGYVDGYDLENLRLAVPSNAVLISISYTLSSTESGQCFPCSFDDCAKVTEYILSNPDDFGIDSKNVVIAGDSAGGNLTAAVCLHLRDKKFSPLPRLQVLIYPALQCVDLTLPSFQQNRCGMLLSSKLMAMMWSVYATGSDKYADDLLRNRYIPEDLEEFVDPNGISRKYHYNPYKAKPAHQKWQGKLQAIESTLTNPYFAPLMAKSLVGLPEAYVFTVQHDVLRDDGLLYVRRLREAGIKVTHNHSPIGFHGIFSMSRDIPEAERCLTEICDFVGEFISK